jgi:hypothetical protein
MRFGYTEALLERYPQLVAGVILVQDLSNPSTPQELDALLRLEEKRIAEAYTTEMLSSLPSIAAWRSAYSAFGTKPSKYRSSVEGLLRRTARDGALPRVSTLVDLCNLASLRAMLPVAAFDLDRVSGDLIVDFGTGEEGYFPSARRATSLLTLARSSIAMAGKWLIPGAGTGARVTPPGPPKTPAARSSRPRRSTPGHEPESKRKSPTSGTCSADFAAVDSRAHSSTVTLPLVRTIRERPGSRSQLLRGSDLPWRCYQ